MIITEPLKFACNNDDSIQFFCKVGSAGSVRNFSPSTPNTISIRKDKGCRIKEKEIGENRTADLADLFGECDYYAIGAAEVA